MRLSPAVLLVGLSIALLTPALAYAHRSISADDIASAFVPAVEAFVNELDAETEELSVRINRCTGRQGELSDVMFYVWVGWRGVASSNNAAQVLSRVHSSWVTDDWDVYRYRELDNGGINVAATQPETGNTYSLDSGFEISPETYIVGFFSTRCFESPVSPAPFGPWRG